MGKIVLYFLVPLFFLAAFTLPDDDLDKFLQKIIDYNTQRPQEKLYLHFDKPLYVAGDDIWFKTYLVDASTHMTDTTNTVVYVELFNPDKKLLKRLVLPSSGGYSHGDFRLGDTLPQGNYAVRSYTNYMKNQGEDFFFFKEITVLNADSARRSKPLSQNTLDVQFFPEGGNMIASVENRIAFKALNSSGKSENVQGDIVDETGKTISSFKTDHAGMGLVRLNPIKGKTYKARVIDNAGTESYFDLPGVEDGYLMRVANNSNHVQVIAYTSMNSLNGNTVYLIAQSRGVICATASGKLVNNTLVAIIPKNEFPSGIVQITLFDDSFVPQCERLVFVDQHNNLTMDIKPDKDSFRKRTKVEIEISAIKENGIPASGNFSISVYDVAKMPEQPYRLSIENYLLLSSDLKGYIEEPGYYLKDTLKNTRYHLDLLMMTQGWRRFTWKEIMEPIAPLTYKFEKGIVVSGSVERIIAKKPAPNNEIKILASPGGLVFTKSDSLGNFYVDGFSHFDSTKLIIQTDDVKGKKTALQLKVNPFNPSPELKRAISDLPSIEATSLVAQTVERNRVLKTAEEDKDGIVLKEVEVKSTRIATNRNERTKLYGIPDNSLKFTDAENKYPNAILALVSKIPGISIVLLTDRLTGRIHRSISINQIPWEPLFILDGRQLDSESAFPIVESISPSMIDHIDILKSRGNTMAYKGGGEGVIAIYTKQGNDIPATPDFAVHNFSYPGFTRAKEFYSPNYSSPLENANVADIRTTLYWNPSLQLDEDGKAKVSFYTSDVLSHYEVVVEGISEDGYPGVGKAVIRVVE